MESLRDLVLKIHGTSYKMVIAITGGGAEAIGELLRHGQGSNTLLEAVVPYDSNSFDEFVHGKPDKYCAPCAARDLAMAAFQRSIHLTKNRTNVPTYTSMRNRNLIGIGVTCSLAKDGEREGRQHHAFIAVQTVDTTFNLNVNLTDRVRSRTEQEEWVAKAIINAIARTCGVLPESPADVLTHPMTEPGNVDCVPVDVADVSAGLKPIACFKNAVSVEEHLGVSVEECLDSRIIFPGAFNPMHDQHIQMAKVAHKIFGKPVDLEICVHNVDKPAMNYTAMRERLNHVAVMKKNQPWAGDVFLTSLPTFMQKAQHFKECVFVVGWDTFLRLGNPKYANLDQVVNTFKKYKTRFLVFHRVVNGRSSAESKNIDQIYGPLMKFAEIIEPEVVPPVEMSSSAIRKGQYSS